MYQTTINNSFSFSGVGLHSGKEMPVTVIPAEADAGIRFVRMDVKNCPSVRVSPFNVTNTQLATTVSCGDFPISTVEHLVSALYGLGVDNVFIQVGGPEVPILDGSARQIADMIRAVGVTPIKKKRRYITFERILEVLFDNKSVTGKPGNEPEITFEIDYDNQVIGKQNRSFILTPSVYFETVAMARTFGFKKDVELMLKMGLAKGGSIDNAVVVGDDGVLNPEGLRSPDEFVSHKILDLIGDLALVGYRILGHIHARFSGHQLNNLFARKFMETPNNYKIIELDSSEKGYGYILSENRCTLMPAVI